MTRTKELYPVGSSGEGKGDLQECPQVGPGQGQLAAARVPSFASEAWMWHNGYTTGVNSDSECVSLKIQAECKSHLNPQRALEVRDEVHTDFRFQRE